MSERDLYTPIEGRLPSLERPEPEVVVLSPEGNFYLDRLFRLFERRDNIDTYTQLLTGLTTPQLQLSVRRAIFSSYRALCMLGYGNEANAALDVDRGIHER